MHSPWTKTIRKAALLSGVGLLIACGATDGEDLGESQQTLSPGNNAAFVSSTIPAAMAPGERRSVQVVMQNTGTAMDGTNTWTTTGYSLYRTVNVWGWVSTPVPVATPVGNNSTFTFVITAPAAGTYNFGARMRQDVLFGATASVPNIVVSNATTPVWSCTYDAGASSVPATLAPGQTQAVSIVLQNTGSATWPTAGTYLKSQDTPASLWGQTTSALTSATAAGATATFNFSIRAPATPGTYNLRRQMFTPEIGEFSLTTGCLDVPITVGGANPLNSALVSQDFPTVMAPSETRAVTVVLQNSGTQTWLADGNYRLSSKNSPSSLWGATLANVTTDTAAGANHSFILNITAPATPGSYAHRWQMRKLNGSDAGDFGVLINIPVTVDGAAMPQYNASVVSQNVPLLMTAGTANTFTIRMNNSGTSAWTGSNFSLFSTNTPTALWGPTFSALGAAETVASGADRDFVINVTAPAAAGTYSSSWRMRQGGGGIGFFGETALTAGIEVTLCGNGTVDAGEQCDDTNLTAGDGCDTDCQNENALVIDLAVDPATRTITGDKQVAKVAIGEFSGDATGDVVIGDNANVSPVGMSFRNQAGRLRGYSGTDFFTGGAEFLTVYGAHAGDSLGAHGAQGLLVGDVTGDGQPDIVVSADGVDGPPMSARTNAGSAYVLAGGAGLTGLVDLGATTAPAALAAEVYGPAASSALRLLALGDLTNDGVADIVLGTTNTVYIVPGGTNLTANLKIDLAAPPAGVVTISGTGIGNSAAVGDFGGSAAPDLVLGAPTVNTEAGAAWGIFGPISSAVNLPGGANVTFAGTGANDHFGQNVAVADMLGTTRADVLISGNQQRKGGLQMGATNVFAGPLTNGASLSPASASLIVHGADQFDAGGQSIAVGDYNNDGISDLAMASYAADGPGNTRATAGEVKVVLGSRAAPATIDLATYGAPITVYGANAGSQLGARQNELALGDLDGDGDADLCAGSPIDSASVGRVDCFQ